MQKFINPFLIAAIIFLCIPRKSFADVSSWQKGVSIYPRSPNDLASDDMDELLQQIAYDNANFVTFVIPYYQADFRSSNIFPGADTPTDQSVIAGIKLAHKYKLSVMLKPHLDSDDTIWRANINPADRDAWYTNYENLILRLAGIAQDYGVEQVCIGTELVSVASAYVNPDNTERFRQIISDLRTVYKGKLTYSANWGPASSAFADEKDHIGFWQDLDYVGISAYFQLSDSTWADWDRSDIAPLEQKVGKPILFTEVGYRSAKSSLAAPYDFKKQSAYDPNVQANAYQVLFSYWADKNYFAGVSMWDFYSGQFAGGAGNTDYTPQGKPAEQILRQWFTPPPKPAVSDVTVEKYNYFEDLNNRLKSFIKIPEITT